MDVLGSGLGYWGIHNVCNINLKRIIHAIQSFANPSNASYRRHMFVAFVSFVVFAWRRNWKAVQQCDDSTPRKFTGAGLAFGTPSCNA
jgi:hypothetical protein